MVIVIFRIHVKPQADSEDLNALNQKMVALVSRMPGFRAMKDYAAQDGGRHRRVRFPSSP
jgi:hypothetical protein